MAFRRYEALRALYFLCAQRDEKRRWDVIREIRKTMAFKKSRPKSSCKISRKFVDTAYLIKLSSLLMRSRIGFFLSLKTVLFC